MTVARSAGVGHETINPGSELTFQAPTLPALMPAKIRALLRATLQAWMQWRMTRGFGISEGMFAEDELGPETQNFRAAQVKKWEQIKTWRDDYYNDARKFTDAATALRAADKYVRPDVRTFVFDLLTRVPAGELPDFVRKFPETWPETTEALLNEPVIPAMIQRSFPKRQQAQHIDELTRKIAEDDAAWGKALYEVAEATGVALQKVGEAVGDGVSGAAEALGGFGRALAWVPVILASAVGVGAVVVGVSYARRRL